MDVTRQTGSLRVGLLPDLSRRSGTEETRRPAKPPSHVTESFDGRAGQWPRLEGKKLIPGGCYPRFRALILGSVHLDDGSLIYSDCFWPGVSYICQWFVNARLVQIVVIAQTVFDTHDDGDEGDGEPFGKDGSIALDCLHCNAGDQLFFSPENDVFSPGFERFEFTH